MSTKFLIGKYKVQVQDITNNWKIRLLAQPRRVAIFTSDLVGLELWGGMAVSRLEHEFDRFFDRIDVVKEAALIPIYNSIPQPLITQIKLPVGNPPPFVSQADAELWENIMKWDEGDLSLTLPADYVPLKVCDCGGEKYGGGTHSDWCSKGNEK